MDKHKTRTLPVRERRVLAGDGEVTSTRTVLCPKHGEAIAVSLCGECPDCERIDVVDGRPSVICHPASPRATMRWASMLHRILPSAADRVAIAEVMGRDLRCVTADVSIEVVTELLLDNDLGALPVVDGEGFPIGMVSKTDLVREGFINGETRAVAPAGVRGAGMHVAELPRATVGEVMMPMAYTLREDEPLSRAAAVMTAEKVHHLAVVAADGRVVGLLSSLDFVRGVAAQSAFVDQA